MNFRKFVKWAYVEYTSWESKKGVGKNLFLGNWE